VLRQLKKLTHLHLGSNDITDTGICSLADELSQYEPLTHLGLSNNQIGSEGCQRLADALEPLQ
jgi:Ran GTPase-activating protein (RanGAP) involved in mRNA processing and transport